MEQMGNKWEKVHREQTAQRIAQHAIEKAAREEAWWEEFNRRQNDPQPETD